MVVIDFLIIVGPLALIVIVFHIIRKISHDDGGTEVFPRMPPPLDDYKGPEVEYSCPDECLSLLSGKNIDEGLSDILRQKVRTLTPATPAGLKLLKFLRSHDTKPEQIARLVATSPIFSVHVLRTVNSPQFNLSSKVNSVGTAILVMGYHKFKKLVESCNLDDFLSEIQDEDLVRVYSRLWLHSAMVSTCAAYLGQNIFRRRYEQELPTMGLLHDIGKYYLPLFDKKNPAADGISSCIGNDAEYGFSHAILGSYIAEECNLPDVTVKAIYYHHHPLFFPPEKIPRAYRLPSFIICLSDLICKTYGHYGKGEQIYPIREEYFEMYDVDLKSIFSKTLEKSLNRCFSTVESFRNY
ncbi:HDOD domain-containing protein [uncultured Desulfobacter sp.]|uniref:HDOD domain-containing protein n=1 Tax=uncultured Desulfobacter sp. TaxID=240139 RepID=UPI002AABE320|nr:HDOD domain-containing protein [uncultured Desulfobacter sp.]